MADRKDESAVVVERRGSGGGVRMFLLGAVLGAGLALLFAPQSGEETRADLRRGARRVRRQVRDLAERGEDMARDIVESGREFVDSGRDVVRDMRRGGRRAARDAREALEERLARHREHFDSADDGV